MITKAQIERYRKYGGDVDKWVKSQLQGRDDLLTGADWTVIDKIVQRLKLEKSGYSTKDYRDETNRLLAKTFENAETIQIVKTLA